MMSFEDSRTLLRRLQQVEWFHAVDKSVDDDAVYVVSNWEEAWPYYGDGYCESMIFEAGVAMEEAISAASTEHKQRLQQFHNQLDFQAVELVKSKVVPYLQAHNLPREVMLVAGADLKFACLEREFRDVVTSHLFNDKINWLLEGHFVCGVADDGKLIVL